MRQLENFTREQKRQHNPYSNNEKVIEEENNTPANTYSDDTLWLEINTEPLLENLYNHWLGKKKLNGVWVDDKNAKPRMTKELADKLINTLRLKVNPHTLISGYDTEEIKQISLQTCKKINYELMFEVEKYGLSVSDFSLLVTNEIKFFIIQTLNMGKDYMNTKLRFGSRSVQVLKREEDNGGMI